MTTTPTRTAQDLPEEASRELLASETAAHLRTLTPSDVPGQQLVARLLADTGISRSMVEDPFLAVGTRLERLEVALSGARVDLEEGCDREALDWNAMVLAQAAAPIPQVCRCGHPAQECTDRGRMGQLIDPEQRVQEVPLCRIRGEG
ncbi:hypothetical protein [Streptomyces lasiicapitis]|uniref:Uncharacterized protein n=1 Tax=Streptomyces lasiicapitis TaxID=1923961 RepID=A0ABQ2MW41_9ACTN|nr:hypothetical protein [Streptomyces lasiicapitis]GGO59068.1 hypothetical protein GCM10012286_79820 [Streptomyces lasiicapitis]